MLSGEGNENSQKTSRSNEKETTLHVQHTFFHRRYKISILFFQRNWSPLFFISRSSSFSVIHVNVEINKVRVVMRFNTEKRGYLKCKISLGLHERGGCTYGRMEDFLKTKISWMHR